MGFRTTHTMHTDMNGVVCSLAVGDYFSLDKVGRNYYLSIAEEGNDHRIKLEFSSNLFGRGITAQVLSQ